MKKLFVIFFIALLAQPAIAESGKACNKSEKLIKKLDLQEDQIEAVQQIMSEQKEKRLNLFQGSRDSVKEQMESLHSETKQKLGSVLNEEQMEKFDALHAERMEKRQQRWEKRKERFNEISKTVES